MRRRIGKKTQEFSGLRGLATLSLSFGFLGTKSPPYPTESFSLFLLQALECLFKAPSVKSFVKKLVRIYMWGLCILFIAFVFLWDDWVCSITWMSTTELVMVAPFSILILLITLMLFVGYPLWAWNNWSIKRELSHEQIIEGPLLTP